MPWLWHSIWAEWRANCVYLRWLSRGVESHANKRYSSWVSLSRSLGLPEDPFKSTAVQPVVFVGCFGLVLLFARLGVLYNWVSLYPSVILVTIQLGHLCLLPNMCRSFSSLLLMYVVLVCVCLWSNTCYSWGYRREDICWSFHMLAALPK
jgi:hypothetical protein